MNITEIKDEQRLNFHDKMRNSYQKKATKGAVLSLTKSQNTLDKKKKTLFIDLLKQFWNFSDKIDLLINL